MEKDVEKCYFVPMSTMRNVIDIIELKAPSNDPRDVVNCKHNLARIQMNRNSKKSTQSSCRARHWQQVFHIACHKAIYAQNWDKLAYLLQKCPPWQHCFNNSMFAAPYIRILTILLMYHPSSQAQGLLNDYLHMVWSCRTIEDKKAILKILLTLPDKIYGSYRCDPVIDTD